jgi:hypothetical protein
MRKLKDPCASCGKPLDPMWKICPFCEAEVGGMAPSPRRARRRRDGASDQPVAPATVRAERNTSPSPAPAPAEREQLTDPRSF